VIKLGLEMGGLGLFQGTIPAVVSRDRRTTKL